MNLHKFVTLGALLLGATFAAADDSSSLPGTTPLTVQGDLSSQMVAGIDKFLTRETERSVLERQKLWQRDFSSAQAYEKSVQPNRERLRKIIGAVDARAPMNGLQFVSAPGSSEKVGETDSYSVYAVRWPVFDGVFGEGLWLKPKSTPLARVVAIPDAGQTPEIIAGLAPGLPAERQFARRLAEYGCEVLVPVLVDRQDTWSGNALLKRYTNQPHREWIYRQAYELGRHIIGYEVQKVLAAVDYFDQAQTNVPAGAAQSKPRLSVAGYAEGGLIAFYAAALDPRIDATLVSGYFDSRQRVWEEPIYRNVFGLLEEFGDAEIASLVAPRTLIVEHSSVPKIDGPPKPHDGRGGAAPGKWITPDYESVEKEFGRARALVKGGNPKDFDRFQFIYGNEGMATGPGSERALTAFLTALGVKTGLVKQPGKA